MNNITIELCAEDRARLDKLTQAIEAMTAPQAPQIFDQSAEPEKENKHPAEMEPTPFPEEIEPEAPASPMPTTEPEPVEEDAPAVTHKDIAKLVIDLAGAGKKDKVKDVVYAYAKKVTDIPEDKLAEVYNQLTALQMEG